MIRACKRHVTVLEDWLRTQGMGETVDTWSRLSDFSRTVLMYAAAIAALHLLPYATRLLYPIEQFVSIAHQSFHAAMAVATGGRVTAYELAWNGTGMVKSLGGSASLTALAGPVGTILLGGALAIASRWRKYASWWLFGLAIAVLGATIFLLSRQESAVPLVGVMMGTVLLAVGRRFENTGRAGTKLIVFGALAALAGVVYLVGFGARSALLVALVTGGSFLASAALAPATFNAAVLTWTGLQCALSGLHDWKPLLFGSMYPGLGHSDAAMLAHVAALPALVWATLWVGLGVATVGGVAWVES